MVWFKVDDTLGFHHKTIAAGNPAMGLWVRAGSVCAQQLTDGFVSDLMAATLGTRAQAERLVSVGLWDREQGGYRFHGWGERQPSKVSVEAERAAASERMRTRRAQRKLGKRDASAQVSDLRSPEQSRAFGRSSEEVRDVFADPDPTRPDPTPVPLTTTSASAPAKRRKQRLPDDFTPNPQHAQYAAENGIDGPMQLVKFRDYHQAKGTTMIDWDAAFRTWLRNSLNYDPPKLRPVSDPSQLPPVEDSWMKRRPAQ
jgi:hypothetical protein